VKTVTLCIARLDKSNTRADFFSPYFIAVLLFVLKGQVLEANFDVIYILSGENSFMNVDLHFFSSGVHQNVGQVTTRLTMLTVWK
jgi:hypothetical protein